MKYSDIIQTLFDKSAEGSFIRRSEVPVDDSDEQYEDCSPLHLACQYGDAGGVKILLGT